MVDTNVLISGIFFGGKPREVLALCFTAAITPYVTDAMVAEYERVVLEMRKRSSREVPREALEAFLLRAERMTDVADVRVCRDPDDDKFIECAVSAKASYIVSGDKDLLVLERHGEIRIVTAAEFLDMVKGQGL